MRFEENHVLFGHDPAARIVAVEPAGDREMHVYRRSEDGASTALETAPFSPFLWLAGDHEGIDNASPLAGGLEFDRLVTCAGWKEFTALRTRLRNQSEAESFALTDPVQQYLTATGRTLFKGLDFADLRRMQLAVEMAPCGSEPDLCVAEIALSDQTGWEERLVVDPADPENGESAALEQLGRLIRERDPDVLEGHHLFKTLLPFLAARARVYRIKLAWGRDGSPITSRASRVQIAEKTINYPKYEIRGRHVVDTYLLAQFYDVGTRELEGFDLDDVARHFGLPPHPPETSLAVGEMRQTRALSDLLSRSYFFQAQIFPYNYQETIVRGNATRINALFLREYLRRGHSIPALPEAKAFEGGYADVFVIGVERNVWHCDVASLYPSVMLRSDIFPERDVLGIFHGLLADLRTFRLEAKARMRQSAGHPERDLEYRTYGALQNVFKILINSFYGYLGFAQGHFADYTAAARVTETGRDLLKKMVGWLEAHGARVIEIDTDGIYFVPPAGTPVATLQAGLTEVLPPGIEIEFDAQYEAMFSYKAKNYALLETSGGLVLKGGALKSRGMERFQRDYLERMIRLLLEGRPGEIAALRAEFESAIRERRWPIEMLAKTDTLQDSLSQYQKKIEASARNRSASYELAARSGRAYQPGDQVRYYITGTKKKVSSYENARLISEHNPEDRDENIEYYVAKLDELARKYAPFIGEASSAPRPRHKRSFFKPSAARVGTPPQTGTRRPQAPPPRFARPTAPSAAA